MTRWRVRVLGLLVACYLWPHGCCGRRRARPPARLGVLTSFGAAPRSPPVPSGPSGVLHTSGAGCAGVWLDAAARSPARPRRPRAPQPGPPGPPAPFTPVGLGVLACGLMRRLEARPGPAAHGHRSQALPRPSRTSLLGSPNFACNSPATISNVEFTALKSQRFQTLLNLHPIELHASFLRSGRIGACWRRRRSPLARCAVV